MKSIIYSGLGGLIIGFVFGLFVFALFHVSADLSISYGYLEIVYYLVTPIGVLATIAAVVVALFGEDFKRLLHKEKCAVFLEKENFVEDIFGQENFGTIESKRYDCSIILKNIGSREIEDCSVYLVSVKHRDNQQGKWKDLKIKNKIQLYWATPNKKKENILEGDSKSLLILRINPDGDQSTPDNVTTKASSRRLSIMGFSPDLKYRQKGFWELDYCICTPHRELLKFRVTAYWSGAWKKREKEMEEETSVNLDILK